MMQISNHEINAYGENESNKELYYPAGCCSCTCSCTCSCSCSCAASTEIEE